MQVTPFLIIKDRPARAAIFLSGSGSNAEKILEANSTRTESNLQVACLVTDRPETSRANALGEQFGLPVVALDIRKFYFDKGLKRVSIRTPEGRAVREEWTNALREKLAPYAVDFGIFAGFVPLCNLAGDFPCLNVHPGDLTYEKNGARHLVGLHTIPIELAILEGLKGLRSSVILAEPFEGCGENMDAGPILGISPDVAVDLQGHTLESLQKIAVLRPDRRPPKGYKDILEAIAEDNQELLKIGGDWVVFPPVVFAFAEGRFGLTEDGTLCYRESESWQPVKTVVFDGITSQPIPC